MNLSFENKDCFIFKLPYIWVNAEVQDGKQLAPVPSFTATVILLIPGIYFTFAP
jgi:hypothetical protein